MPFAHPAWFAALMLLPVLIAVAVVAARTRGRAWRVLAAPRLRSTLVRRGSPLPRWLALAALLAALACLIAALARPQGAGGTLTEALRGRNVLLVIDLSRSMLVPDVSPNRLDQARTLALELLDSLPDDRVGALAFAGTPFLVAPLTVDHAAVRETLQQLDPDTIPTGGSDLAGAVQLGAKVFRDNGIRNGALVILSDGEEHSGRIADAALAADRAGMFIFAVGVGTQDGGFIPDPQKPDGRFRDREGNVVLSRLQDAPLRDLAGKTGGRFLLASSGAAIGPMVDAAISDLERFEIDTRRRVVSVEFFQWLILPAVLLLMAAVIAGTHWRPLTRRSAAIAATIAAIAATHGPASHHVLAHESAGQHQGAPASRRPPVTGFQPATPAFHRPPTAETRTDSPASSLTPIPCATPTEPPADPAPRRYADLANQSSGEARARYRLAEGNAALAAGDPRAAREALSAALLADDPAVQAAAHHNLANSLVDSGWRTLADGKPYPAGNQAASELDALLTARLTAWFAEEAGEAGTSEGLRVFESVLLAWTDAVRHYDSAIAADPTRADSRHNRQVASRLLERLRKAIDQTAEQLEQQLPEPEPPPQPGDQGESQPQPGDQSGEQPPQQGDGNQQQAEPPDGSGDQQQQENQPGDEQENDGRPDEQPGERPDRKGKDQEGQETEQQSPEQRARRMLQDNADFERGPLIPGLRREFRRPAKDW